jgi:hypothetical protein
MEREGDAPAEPQLVRAFALSAAQRERRPPTSHPDDSAATDHVMRAIANA